jgi:hypothetical protein
MMRTSQSLSDVDDSEAYDTNDTPPLGLTVG